MKSHALAMLANVLWGLMPLYYFFLGPVDPARMLAYQVVFTALTLGALALLRKQRAPSQPLWRSLLPALLLASNWLAYLGAVTSNHVLEASYGYLIMPLLTVLCGWLLLGERLTSRQWLGISLCAAAVLLDALCSRVLPLRGVAIAIPFALYSSWHKSQRTADPVFALKNEAVLMTPVAVLYLAGDMGAAFEVLSGPKGLLVASVGLINALPLVIFVRACPDLGGLHLGLYQFIAPILSAALAVALFNNNPTDARLLAGLVLVAGICLATLPPLRRQVNLLS